MFQYSPSSCLPACYLPAFFGASLFPRENPRHRADTQLKSNANQMETQLKSDELRQNATHSHSRKAAVMRLSLAVWLALARSLSVTVSLWSLVRWMSLVCLARWSRVESSTRAEPSRVRASSVVVRRALSLWGLGSRSPDPSRSGEWKTRGREFGRTEGTRESGRESRKERDFVGKGNT
jgi:hypothetical protein